MRIPISLTVVNFLVVMPGKKTQSTISGAGFKCEAQLTTQNIKSWCVASFDDAAATLLDEWNGKLIGLAGVSLSSDNRLVEHSEFLLQGFFFDDEPHKILANKFWPLLPPRSSLIVRDFDSSSLNFTDNLVSSYLDHEQIEYQFVDKNGDLLSEEVLTAASVNGFTLRAFVVPTGAKWANLHVVLYPQTEAVLRDAYPLCDDIRFPGIQAFKLQFPLGPPAMLKWGHPINPAVLPGAPVDDFSRFPNAADFSRAISALFRKAVQPDLKANTVALQKRFSHMVENAHDVSTLNNTLLELIWPQPSARPAPQGW